MKNLLYQIGLNLMVLLFFTFIGGNVMSQPSSLKPLEFLKEYPIPSYYSIENVKDSFWFVRYYDPEEMIAPKVLDTVRLKISLNKDLNPKDIREFDVLGNNLLIAYFAGGKEKEIQKDSYNQTKKWPRQIEKTIVYSASLEEGAIHLTISSEISSPRPWGSFWVAIVCSIFVFFLALLLADEFKDLFGYAGVSLVLMGIIISIIGANSIANCTLIIGPIMIILGMISLIRCVILYED